MNKIIASIVLTCGLLLLDSPEAAAHDQRHSPHRGSTIVYSDHYRGDAHGRRSYNRDGYYRNGYYRASAYKRANKMPHWLKHDRSFRRWYEHTQLRRDRYLSWQVMFDIYRWEHSGRRYRKH